MTRRLTLTVTGLAAGAVVGLAALAAAWPTDAGAFGPGYGPGYGAGYRAGGPAYARPVVVNHHRGHQRAQAAPWQARTGVTRGLRRPGVPHTAMTRRPYGPPRFAAPSTYRGPASRVAQAPRRGGVPGQTATRHHRPHHAIAHAQRRAPAWGQRRAPQRPSWARSQAPRRAPAWARGPVRPQGPAWAGYRGPHRNQAWAMAPSRKHAPATTGARTQQRTPAWAKAPSRPRAPAWAAAPTRSRVPVWARGRAPHPGAAWAARRVPHRAPAWAMWRTVPQAKATKDQSKAKTTAKARMPSRSSAWLPRPPGPFPGFTPYPAWAMGRTPGRG